MIFEISKVLEIKLFQSSKYLSAEIKFRINT